MVDTSSMFAMPDWLNPSALGAANSFLPQVPALPGFSSPAAPAVAPAPTAVGGLTAAPVNTNVAAGGGAAVPGVAGAPAAGVNLGPNVGTAQAAIGGLSALGNLWTAWNATNLAKQQFAFQKNLASDNYTNQAKGYNTELTDKANTRAAMENQTPGQAQQYIAANSLKTTI